MRNSNQTVPVLCNLEDILSDNNTNTQKAQDMVSLIRGSTSLSNLEYLQTALALADLQFRGVTRRKKRDSQANQPVKPNTLEYVGNRLASHFDEETPASRNLTDTAAHFYWTKNNTYEILFESIDNRTSFAKTLNEVVKNLHNPTTRYNTLQAATDIYGASSFDVDDNLLEAAKAMTSSGRSWESKYQTVESHLQKFQESAGARKLSLEEEDLVKRMQSYVQNNKTLKQKGRARTAKNSYSDIKSNLLNDLNTLGMFGSDGFVGSWQDENDEDSGLFDQLPGTSQYQNIPNTPTYAADDDFLSQKNPSADLQYTPVAAIPFGANDSHARYEENKPQEPKPLEDVIQVPELSHEDKLELAKRLAREALANARASQEVSRPKSAPSTYISKPLPQPEPIVIREMPKDYPPKLDEEWGADDSSPVSKVTEFGGRVSNVYDLTKPQTPNQRPKGNWYLAAATALLSVGALAGCVAALQGAPSPESLYQKSPTTKVEQVAKPTTETVDASGPEYEISDLTLRAQYAAKEARSLGIDVSALYTPFAVEMNQGRTHKLNPHRPSPTDIKRLAEQHGITRAEVRVNKELMKKVSVKPHWGVDTNALDGVVELQAVVDGFYCKSRAGGFGDIIIGFEKSGAYAQDLGSHDNLAFLYAHLDKDGYSGIWDNPSRQVDLLSMKFMFPGFDKNYRKTQCIHAQGGEILATVGNTGASTDSHLHFEAAVCDVSNYAGFDDSITWMNSRGRHKLLRTDCTSIDPMPLLQVAEKYAFRWDIDSGISYAYASTGNSGDTGMNQ